MYKKISVLFFLIGIFFVNANKAEAADVVQYNWTTGVLDGDRGAGSANIRNNYGPSLSNRLVYTYITNDGLGVYFSTSTLGGASWSTPQYVTSTAPEMPFLLSEELPATQTPSNQELIFLNHSGYPNVFGVSFGPYAGATASSTYLYEDFVRFTDFDAMLYPIGGGQFGTTLFGLWPFAGVNFLMMSKSTGNYTTDTFQDSTIEDFGDDVTVRSDAEYFAMGSGGTAGAFSYITSEEAVLHTYIGYIPFALDGSSGENVTSTIVSGGAGTPVALEVDQYGIAGVAFVLCGGSRGSFCDLYFAEFDFNDLAVGTAQIIYSGIPQSDNIKIGIASRHQGRPVIVFSDGSNIRYAARELSGRSGNDACVGATVTDWSCGIVQSGVSTVSALNVQGMRYTGSSSYEDQIAVVWSDGSQIYYAQGLPTDVEYVRPASSGSAFPKIVKPENPIITVNNGISITADRTIPVVVKARDVSYVAISTSPDFINAAWQEIAPVNYIALSENKREQTVYVKVSNISGGQSNVVTQGIYYEPRVKNIENIEKITEELGRSLENSDSDKTEIENQGQNTFIPGYLAFLKNQSTQNNFEPSGRYSCNMRPNAFTLGGSIIRDTATKKLFVIDSNRKIACEVPSTAVARSWGVTKYGTGSVSSYMLATPLSYRPGTVVVDSKTGERYFTNSQGELHKFPSLSQYKKLGYAAQAFYYDTTIVISTLPRSADLIRTDIHPDGTLFVLDKKKGEYAVLHNRVLHPLTIKSIGIYGEKSARAIRLLSGEEYPIGDRWDP